MITIRVTYKNGDHIDMSCVYYMIDITNNCLYLLKASPHEDMRPIHMDNIVSIESI